jgi:hypothetical protein
MRRSLPVLAVLSGLILAASAHAQRPQQSQAQSSKQTYKWVDDKGVTHYGDHVPSEYSQREQRVLNSQGLEVQKRQAEMSQAQAAAIAAKQKEESQRKQHDMFLLSTYPTVREIENVRDVRLDQIQGQISAAEAYISSLTTRIDRLKLRSQQFAPYNATAGARRMPDDLVEEMVRALSELRSQNSAIAQRRVELKAVNDQFDGDIRRFKELRSAAAARLNDANRAKSER